MRALKAVGKTTLYAAYETLKSKRFWKWELGSLGLYLIPASYRHFTGNITLPILNPSFNSPSPYIPNNPLGKFVVNAFFPGGAGGVGGEELYKNYTSRKLTRKEKYLSRLFGALTQTGIFTSFQYVGHGLNWIGSWGGNWFEAPEWYPFNFLLASASVFTPDVVNYVDSKIGLTDKLNHLKSKLSSI